MPTTLSLTETEARKELREFRNKKITLKRDVFFVPGWTDEGCICWTEPYIESGEDKLAGWEYTVADWEYLIENPQRMHYIRLVRKEKAISIIRDRRGKIKKVEFQSDPSYNYTNFFQFAELLKAKIREEIGKRDKNQIDLVGHSMGGLDVIAAITLKPSDDYPEIKKFIKTEPLDNVGLAITVSTPYKGSLPSDMVKHSRLHEILRPEWSHGTREQCENMAFDSPFIKIINRREIRERLLEKSKKGAHTFSGANDAAVKPEYAFIDGAENHQPFKLAAHSHRMGITKDPRFHLELFTLLKG